jgi:hypothetical protein
MSPRISTVALSLVCLSLCACAKDEVRTYKVAKEKQKSMPTQEMPADHPPMSGQMPADHPPMQGQLPPDHPPMGGAMTPGAAAGPAVTAVTAPAAGDLVWTAPADWQAKPLGQMRRGSFALKGSSGTDSDLSVIVLPGAAGDLVWTAPADWQAKPLGQMRRGSFALKGSSGTDSDLSVIVLPGAAGGNLDNVNRWRGQVGLPPIAQAALADEATPMATDSGLEVLFVDLKGAKNDSILGGIIVQQGQSWFFKLRGPTAQLQEQKPAFIAFLKTVKVR